MKQSDLNSVIATIREVAKDLESCGTDEWDSANDCVRATISNVKHDLNELLGTDIEGTKKIRTYPCDQCDKKVPWDDDICPHCNKKAVPF